MAKPKTNLGMHVMFEQHIQAVRQALQGLNNTMALIPPFNITVEQTQALHDTLRYLDLVREYKVGGKLRKAFRIELDALEDHTRRGLLKRRG